MLNGRLGAITPALGAIGFVALWWLVYALKVVDPVLLPSPGDSFKALWSGFASGGLTKDFIVTIRRTLYAFAIAVAISVPLGVMLGTSQRLYRTSSSSSTSSARRPPRRCFRCSSSSSAWARQQDRDRGLRRQPDVLFNRPTA